MYNKLIYKYFNKFNVDFSLTYSSNNWKELAKYVQYM